MIQTQAIYENGVLRPLSPLPLQERQTVQVMIVDVAESLDELTDWEFIETCRAQSVDAPSLEEVRRLLAGIPGSLSDAVVAEREDARY